VAQKSGNKHLTQRRSGDLNVGFQCFWMCDERGFRCHIKCATGLYKSHWNG